MAHTLNPGRELGPSRDAKMIPLKQKLRQSPAIDKTDKEAHGVGWGVDLDYEK